MTRARRVLVATGLSLAGLALGLGVAEMVFTKRDDGAFPQLNCYAADPALGVRLVPGCREQMRFGSTQNPITSVAIGGQGFRGELPPPGPLDVLVAGDSQVFGLGVEENERFGNVLEPMLPAGTHVVNLGVPTYGPDEYEAVLEHELETRKATTMVYVLNLVNDLFEATRPNVGRHAVLDGWAVRKEHAPEHAMAFPFRDPLFRGSHLVHAWRTYRGRQEDGEATPSEGGYGDLLDTAHADAELDAKEKAAHDAALVEGSLEAKAAHATLIKAEIPLQRVLYDALHCDGSGPDGAQCADVFPESKPGDRADRFWSPAGEQARPTRVTADLLHRAALLRAYQDDNAAAMAEVEKIPAVQPAAKAWHEARTAYEAIVGKRPTFSPPQTPLSPALARAAAFAKSHGVRLVVAVLPVDVVVSPTEWAKYGQAEGPDLSAIDRFAQTIVERTKLLGAEAIDLTPALRAAEPGAFLLGDIHLTPKGHRAVAEALAAVLTRPPPAPAATAQTAKPSESERWFVHSYGQLAADYNLQHRACVSDTARDYLAFWCPTLKQHDTLWLQSSRGFATTTLEGIVFDSLDESEVLTGRVGELAFALGPVSISRPYHLTFYGDDGKPHGFVGRATADGAYLGDGAPADTVARPHPHLPPSDPRFLACAQQLPNEPLGPSDADCVRTYESSCALMLACSRGAAFAAPRCGEGREAVGPFQRCYERCDPKAPVCHEGRTCVRREEHDVCLLAARTDLALPDYQKAQEAWDKAYENE